jgi:hypothetical protein
MTRDSPTREKPTGFNLIATLGDYHACACGTKGAACLRTMQNSVRQRSSPQKARVSRTMRSARSSQTTTSKAAEVAAFAREIERTEDER